ncbi:MAG: glycoside hydrolase domain-containing protein [Burkholderiaceae bacterium]
MKKKFNFAFRPQSTGRVLALCCAVLLLAYGGWQLNQPSPPRYGGVSAGCVNLGESLMLCAASDMARPTRQGPVALEHSNFDLTDGVIRLDAARNETIAWQFIVQTRQPVLDSLEVIAGALEPHGKSRPLTPVAHQSFFQAHYLAIENGGYKWGPPTLVLPYPASYPDALIPQRKPCQAGQQLFERFSLPTKARQNQAIWIDTFVGKTTPPGRYIQTMVIRSQSAAIEVRVELTVHAVTLPDRPSIDAVGEVYAAYALEGVGIDVSHADWQAMAQCYQQLAHRHRLIFIERFPRGLEPDQLDGYVEAFGPILKGDLFTPAHGYRGPGQGEPVSLWRPPWPQRHDLELAEPLTQAQLDQYEQLARQWQVLLAQNDWRHPRYFAYIFDEVDGPAQSGVSVAEHRQYIAMAHQQMGRVQKALDRGAPEQPIDLLWTSHSNPAQWRDEPDLNLVGKVRVWAPNASAADPVFLAERRNAGDSIWFYHSGHPAIGAHSINASGIEMRTWGVVGARYGFDGQFMWAVNLGSPVAPYEQPSYKPDDDRVGNGVLVYPGNQLPALGKPGLVAAPGPVPSMRLKSWRRGLQDAELYFLARARQAAAAERLIRNLIPTALADARGSASWSDNPSDWIAFRRELLRLAAQ